MSDPLKAPRVPERVTASTDPEAALTLENVVAPVKALADVPVWVKDPSFVISVIPVKAPVAEMSQSLESIAIVSPPSPSVTAPPGVRVKAPFVVKVVVTPEKFISVSATVKLSKVLAPVKV